MKWLDGVTDSVMGVWLFVTPMDCRLLGLSVHGILQSRILECVAMPSSRESSRLRDWTRCPLCLLHWQWVLYHYRHVGVKVKVSQCVWLFETPWTVGSQAPLFMGILQVRILGSVSIPLSGDLPNQGMNPGLLHCRQILTFLTTKEISATWESHWTG